VQAYQTSQYVVPRGVIFLGKWRSTFAGISDGKANVQSACSLNTLYLLSRLVQAVTFRIHVLAVTDQSLGRETNCRH
jgi:hypothetical protein